MYMILQAKESQNASFRGSAEVLPPPPKKRNKGLPTVGTKIICSDPEKILQELISENLVTLLRDMPCPELTVVSSNFQVSLFLQNKLLESVCTLFSPKQV